MARDDPQRRAVLLLLCAAELMVVVDFSVVNVALPAIKASLGFSDASLQWVVGAYGIVFGGFLLVGGRATDVLGGRRMFLVGSSLFAVASAACAGAPSDEALVAARAIQGLGAAIVVPAGLAMIVSTYAEGGARDRALGIYGGIMSAGFAGGVIAGGLVIEALGWRWVMLVSAPIAALAAACGAAVLPRSAPRPMRPGLHVVSAAAITAAMAALVYAIARGTERGWGSTANVVPAAAAAAALAAFSLIERRARAPLLPPAFLREPGRLAVGLTGLLVVGTGVGATYVLTLHLQAGLGYTPLQTGLALAPFGVAALLAGRRTARLIGAVGLRATLMIGLAGQVGGALCLTGIDLRASVVWLLVGIALLGVGHVVASVAVTIAATAGVARESQGLASGFLSTMQTLGSPVGLAIVVAVADARSAGATDGFRLALVAAGALSAAAVVLVTLTRSVGRPVT